MTVRVGELGRGTLLVLALGVATAFVLTSADSAIATTAPFAVSTGILPEGQQASTSSSALYTVDPTTLYGKAMFGYQGWFACPGDGSPSDRWVHWFRGQIPTADYLTVDMWPDMSEFAQEERCETMMALPDGRPATVFSSYPEQTTRRHFRWMREYGIDGVFLARFVSQFYYTPFLGTVDGVAQHVRTAAEAHDRVFAIEYAIDDGANWSTFVQDIIDDWTHLVDDLKITESPRYLHHKGRPLLAIYGLGFVFYQATPEQAMALIEYFHSNAPERYRATLMAGIPTHWRNLGDDSWPDPAWADVYRSFDVISPWTVGRYDDNVSADTFRLEKIEPDMAEAALFGVEYLPVVWPGSSALHIGLTSFNRFPRNGGHFFWRQVYNAIDAGATMLFVAMFDEVDEGTAMFKLAPTSEELPVGAILVPLDIDGYRLPSDWYLRLGGNASRMLRGEIPLSLELPRMPDPPVARFTFAPSAPVPGEPLTFDASASEDPDGSIVSFMWSFGDGSTASGVTVEHAYAQDGTFNVTLTVIDGDGLRDRTTRQIAVALHLDTTNPSIAITVPGDGDRLNSPTVTVAGTASDDVGLARVEISADGTTWILAQGTTSWSGTITLAEGTNTILARATDTSGNEASASREVVVDTVIPSVAITEPGPILRCGIVTVSGTTADNVAVEKVELSADGESWTLADGTTSWSGTLTVTEVSPTIYVRVTDTGGNEAIRIIQIDEPPGGACPLPLFTVSIIVGSVAAVVASLSALLISRRRLRRRSEPPKKTAP